MAFLNEDGVRRLWAHIISKLNNKVDKVEGKDLSTNDFTNAEKEKLASAVLSVNGVEPDENGEIETDYVCKAAFYVSGGTVTCDKTFLELYNAILKPKVCSTEFVYIDDDVSPYSRFELTYIDQPTVPKNSGSGIKVINVCHFGDTVAPIIIDPETQSFYLDPNWVAPAEPITELVQADWNENDETSDAYVKNRTHYKTYEVTTFIDDEAFPFDYFGMGFGTLPVELEFKVGETYTVIWEGTTYECVCKEDDAKYVGNFSILKYTAENTGEPFLITPLAVTTKAAGTSHSIKATGPLAVYHKIDEKYLPDSVVKSVNNILPDENGNVELEIATDDDILALMMEVDALPVVMDESGAIMTDEEGAILLA